MTPPVKQNHAKDYLSVELLIRLSQICGHRFDIERLGTLVDKTKRQSEGDPMSDLAGAVKEIGLRLTAVTRPLTDAVWHSHLDMPVVFWSKKEERFFIVSYAGTFQVRLALFDSEDGGSVTISRAALASKLGLEDLGQLVEVGLIHPVSPEEHASSVFEKDQEAIATRHAAGGHGHGENDHGHGHGGSHGIPPLSRFLKVLRPERRDILLLVVFALFSGILYLALPLAVDAVVTNLAFGTQDQPYIQALLTVAQILAVCLLLQAFIVGFQYYVSELIQRKIFIRTAGDLAYRLPRVQARELDNVHAPELVNRFMDVVTMQKNTAFFLMDGLNVFAAIVIGVLLLSLYHPLLLVYVIVLVILVVGGTWLLGRKAVKTSIEESRSKYDLVAWFEEIAAYPFVFKGPGGTEMAYQRTNQLATAYIDRRVRHYKIVFRQIVALLILSVISSVTLLVLGAWLVLSQQITLGQLVASELIMGGIVGTLMKFGKKLEVYYDTMAAMDKLGHLFDLEIEPVEGESPEKTNENKGMLVEARELNFAYGHGEELFGNRSFTLMPGEKVALYGPQGSGLSSMLDLLFLLRHPTAGHLAFDGLDSRNWKIDDFRESVELLRRDEFIDGTIVENLRLGRNDIGFDEIRSALEEVGLLNDLMSQPEGLNLRLYAGGRPLTTSQRISLLIARALVQRPRLLLIDELFDGLNPQYFKRLQKVVLDPKHSWTVVIATRMNEVIAICDHSIELGSSSDQKQSNHKH